MDTPEIVAGSPPLPPSNREHIEQEVWEHLYDACRLSRYYAYLSDNYRKWHIGVRFFLFVSATAGVASFINVLDYPWQQPVQVLFGLVLAATLAIDFVLDWGRKSAILHAVSVHCGLLENDWEKLWADMRSMNMENAEIIARDRELSHTMVIVTSTIGFSDISEDHELNEQCLYEATEYLRSRYATAEE